MLSGVSPQPQFLEQLLGVHDPQLFQRGLHFLGDLRVALEVLEDLAQGFHRHAVALALEIERTTFLR